MENLVRVGISHGDINGIGYEIIIKSLLDTRLLEICTPIVYGSSKVMAYHRKALNIDNFSLNSIQNAKEANPKRGNIINCVDDTVRVELGKPSKMAGEAAFMALEKAVQDLMEHQIDVLVTAPINKYTIQRDDFDFPGHTEYLQTKFDLPESLMLMVSHNLKVGVVTGHIPLANVPGAISIELIMKKLRLMNEALQNDFNIRKPRIAVLGLNPHIGDQGLIGKEEEEIIEPAVNQAREEGIMALGPYSADGLFGTSNYSRFDAVLAMYHDQGLAPFKAIAFDSGVNFTAGLPVIRTSPAHGTAYEIAGEDKASPESMRQAIYLAIDTFKTRKLNRELVRNSIEQTKE
jgi:4-hydroxythreonine-4-phosphate dehydrogenase